MAQPKTKIQPDRAANPPDPTPDQAASDNVTDSLSGGIFDPPEADNDKERPKIEPVKTTTELRYAEGSLAFDELRLRFACIALAEIVRWQVAERKAGQEDVAASWAFRYADRMMDQAVKPPSRGSVNVRGVHGVTVEPIVEVQ